MGYWQNRYVVVTGGRGFLGTHLCDRLSDSGALVTALDSTTGDLRLRDKAREAYDSFPLLSEQSPVLFHLAARVSGIGAIAKHPASSLYDNLMMGLNTLQAAADNYFGGTIVMVGSVCAYPKNTPQPMIEENLWEGYPESTNGPYGIAKRTLVTAADVYHEQYGLRVVSPMLANLYGPGDDFDPVTSHVIPALMRKMILARENNEPEVVVWGSGNASRDFLYVHDAVSALMAAAERMHVPEPINIGTGVETLISGLVSLMAKIVRYEGEIVYDTSKPDGQPRRCLQTRKAKSELGWTAKTPLEAGLRETFEWYEPILLRKLRQEADEEKSILRKLKRLGFRV